MKTSMAALLTAIAILSLTTALAFAGNAHFINNATYAYRDGQNLVVMLKEAGLESGAVERVTARALVTATFSCVNGGAKVPSDPKKTTISREATGSGEFAADRNGTISGSLTISPPSASDVGFSCPSGQTATLMSLSYWQISVVDEDSGASMAIKGSY